MFLTPWAEEPQSIWRSFQMHPKCASCCCFYWVQVPGAGSGGLQGWPPWGEARAAPCRTQLVPTDPPQGTTEPTSQDGGTSVATYLTQGKKMLHSICERGEKRERNKPADTKAWKGGKEALQLPEGGFPTVPGGPTLEPTDTPEGPRTLDTPRRSRGKVWGGRSCREELLWTEPKPPFLTPCCVTLARGVWSEGVKLNLWQGGGQVLFQCLSFYLPLPKLVSTFLF